MHGKRSIAMAVTSAVMATAAMLAMPNTASADANDNVTVSEVNTAINGVASDNGGLIVKPAPSSADANSAAVVATEGMTADIPRDAGDGVSLATDGAPSVTIALPDADATGKRQPDGAVQMITTIANSGASTRYPYPVDVATGGKVVLTKDGGAVVLDAEGTTVLVVPTPWAKDANNVEVPASFETDGAVLTLVVNHTSEAYAYPIVADPFWIAPAAIAAALQTALYICGAGYLAGMVWHVAWGNSWAWDQIRRSGRQGCIEAVVGRYIPWGWIKGVLRLK